MEKNKKRLRLAIEICRGDHEGLNDYNYIKLGYIPIPSNRMPQWKTVVQDCALMLSEHLAYG